MEESMVTSRKLIVSLLLAVMLFAAAPALAAAPRSAASTREVVKETVTWTIPAGQCSSLSVEVTGSGQRNETIVTTTNADGSQRQIIDDVVIGTAVDTNGMKYSFFYGNHSIWNTPASGTPVSIKMNDLFLLQTRASAANNGYVVKAAFTWRWTYDPNTSPLFPPVDNFVNSRTIGEPLTCDPI
jgi:hypothetical protein